MRNRLRAVERALAGAALVALLSACGGGGGGGSAPVPTSAPSVPVTSTPAPGTLSVPGKQSSGGGAGGFVNDGKNLSTYAVTSNPSGLAFTVGGQSYTTPATVTPAASTSALTIAFSSGYTVPIVQVYDGAHTVFYNQAADSKGTVAVSSLQSSRRGVASVRLRAGGRLVHRAMQRGIRYANDVDPSRVAVRLSAAALHTSGRTPQDLTRLVGSTGHATLSATTDPLQIMTVPAGMTPTTFARKLEAMPEVAEVTAVHRRHTLSRAATAVSDPYFEIPDQWYDYATGANYAWSYNPGTGAKIAIIDTGIDDNNTDLTSQLSYQETALTPIDNTPTSANGGTPTCEPISGDTTVVTANSAQDDDGHGTNVASIAVAKSNSVGFAGAAWGASLLAFKIFPTQNQYCNDNSSNFGADTADEAVAIADAITNGADVISLSLGSSSFDTTEFNAIETAIADGVTVVAAAGNSDDGSGTGTLDYPAAYPGVISVGASALDDEYYTTEQPQNTGTYASSTEIVASYSQYGPSLGVVAPGGEASECSGSTCDEDTLHWIENYSTSTAYLAAYQCTNASPATNCIAVFNGTSQATPQVAATAAMLIAEAGGHGHLTPAQVAYVIDSTADNINDSRQGHGRLNSYRALASLIRDTSAYSGPIVQKAGTAQLIAFAYTKNRTNVPTIIDATFPAGIAVGTTGAFEIADVPAATGAYRVAVWYDANGDGVIDAGDQIGVASTSCSSTAVCAIGTITMSTVTSGYYLP